MSSVHTYSFFFCQQDTDFSHKKLKGRRNNNTFLYIHKALGDLSTLPDFSQA